MNIKEIESITQLIYIPECMQLLDKQYLHFD